VRTLIFYGTPTTDFSGLSNLKKIDYRLNLGGNQNLKDLSSLSNLKYVGDMLQFHCAENLRDLSGLDGVEHVGEAVFIAWGVSNNSDFVPISSDAWLCQPENAGIFSNRTFNGCDLASQSEVCGL
jgi:hypothetical protein